MILTHEQIETFRETLLGFTGMAAIKDRKAWTEIVNGICDAAVCSSPEYIRERLTKNIKMSSLINLSRTSEQVIDGIIAALCGEGKL